ncbi:DUF2953 domain-containing protein [Paenibacillus silviterrae]|uniref:DUF2953 domain-containing protein n=1 Tax=Paenibacillus silviterrae TaxID=3242194 RepID=UPI002543A698|nr:DUF2953 domain-containing protein [Paenibacillus chinjuensis]
MLWLWVLLALVLLIIFIVLASSLQIRFSAARQGENDEAVVDVKGLFGLFKYRLHIPFVKFKNFSEGVEMKLETVNRSQGSLLAEGEPNITGENIKNAFEDLKDLLRHTFQFNRWLTGMLSHVRCTDFQWTTKVGVGDAPSTAVTTGMVWGLKSSFLGFAFRYIRLETQPRLNVVPNFNQTEFTSVAKGLLYLRNWHLMVGLVSLLLRVTKVKGGMKVWQQVIQKAIHARPLHKT